MHSLIEIERNLHQLEYRTDEKFLTSILHTDFMEVGKSGRTFDFSSILLSLANEKPTDSIIHSQNFELKEINENTALLLYQTVIIAKDGLASNFAKRSSLWVKENNWKLRFHQGTPCGEFKIIL